MEKEIQSARGNNAEVKIGLIGLGSIGTKHALSLKEIGCLNVSVLRTFKGARKEKSSELDFIKELNDETAFFNSDLDGVIIANPTSLHVKYIKKCLDCNIPVLVEKPISSNVDELLELVDKNTDLIRVGFCLRFHPVIQLVKTCIDNDKLGKIYHSRLNVGQFLPHWHPYTDYRNEYYSKHELGGGAIRTLSHELDLLFHFHGKPNSLFGYVKKISNLEIDVDDYSLILAEYENTVSRVEIDFFARKAIRNGVIYGSKGELRYDAINNNVLIIDNDGKEEKLTISVQDMFIEQMKDFVKFIKIKESSASTFEDSLNMMQLIKKAEGISNIKLEKF